MSPGLVGPPPPDRLFGINQSSLQAQGLFAWWPMLGTIHPRVEMLNARRALEGNLFTSVPGMITLAPTADRGIVPIFNGTNSAISAYVNLTGLTKIALSFWLYWDTFANDGKLAFEFTVNVIAVPGGFIVEPNAGSGGFHFGSLNANPNYWIDRFTRPSAAAWHHYLLVMDRATPVNLAYVDGVSVTLTTDTHLGTLGTLTADYLNFMYRESQAGARALWGAGKLTDVRIYVPPFPDAATLAAAIYSPVTRWEMYQPSEARLLYPPSVAATAFPAFYYAQQRSA